jgi:type IV pilus assembly protein PilC
MSSSTYVFKAIDVGGRQSHGEVEAESKQSVADQLKSKGLIVLDIADKRKAKEIEMPWLNRVKLGDISIMTRQIATMISSGMTILRSLYVLEAQTENKKLAETLVAVRKDVEAGLPLSDALERHPKIFNPLFVAMTRAGETGGVLDSALLRVADQLEKDDSLRRQVKSAMAYPIVVFTFAMAVLIGMIAFIVPVFVGVFKDFGGELPAITKFTVALSNMVTGQWYFLIAGAIGTFIGFRKWKSSSWGRPQWDALRLRIPCKIGVTVQKIALARWSRTFSAL